MLRTRWIGWAALVLVPLALVVIGNVLTVPVHVSYMVAILFCLGVIIDLRRRYGSWRAAATQLLFASYVAGATGLLILVALILYTGDITLIPRPIRSMIGPVVAALVSIWYLRNNSRERRDGGNGPSAQ
jgi:hypothetical protein